MNPLTITGVEKATLIEGAGLFVCLVAQGGTSSDPLRFGVFLPESTIQRPLDIITAQSMSFDGRQYFVSQGLILPKVDPPRYLFRSHSAVDECRVPEQIPIYRGAMINSKGLAQHSIPMVRLASFDEIKNHTNIPLTGRQKAAVFVHPVIGNERSQPSVGKSIPVAISAQIDNQPIFTLEAGSDNRIHARHYPVLTGTFLLDLISVPIQIVLFFFVNKGSQD
jgi:hypothetical protein